MNFFQRFFSTSPEDQTPPIRFGRYTDTYKELERYAAWDRALEMFDEKQYKEAYKAFFEYLYDRHEDNVKYWENKKGELEFELIQGSKKIVGCANAHKFKAQARVARAEALHIGFMRRLLEQNYEMQYSRYALDEDDQITIHFDTYTLDGSPYKLYFALKEVATKADKQDDLLLDEFPMLHPVEVDHLVDLPKEEKEVKYRYLYAEIQDVLSEIADGPLSAEQYPGGIAYLLLDLVYKLDYLINPEGTMMEALERMHRQYFAVDQKTVVQKNKMLQRELQKLLERPKEAYFEEMYKVSATFGITTQVDHAKLVTFIDGELNSMDWYRDNGFEKVAMAVPGYIVGFCMFNYALPRPDRDFFHLYYRIVEHELFEPLGFSPTFWSEKKALDKRAIKRAIQQIVDKHVDQFPDLNPKVQTLKYDTLPNFAKSYLMMIRQLNLTAAL